MGDNPRCHRFGVWTDRTALACSSPATGVLAWLAQSSARLL